MASLQEALVRATIGHMCRAQHARRRVACLPNPKLSFGGRYYCLHFAANISTTCALLKRRGKYISESESCDTSDSDEDKYPPGEGTVVIEPHVVEFPTYAAMEEEKWWTELLAFPWQRGRTERFHRRLEKKYFPKHGLDSMLLPEYRKKMAEASSYSSKSSSASPAKASGFANDRVYKKLDYPTIAKALSPGAEEKESFRSQRSRPSSGKKTTVVDEDGTVFTFDTSPSIRTIRAPLSEENELSVPSAQLDAQSKALSENEGIDTEIGSIEGREREDVPDTNLPVLVKHGMMPPEIWNIANGTVVLIDKPKGCSSFFVCDRIRKTVRVKKVGHAGTLDPMATGLLVVCVGRATKLADRYQALTKEYSGTFRLGEATPSCDADTPVNERKPWEHITENLIERVRKTFIGELMQIPPMYSAIKVDGVRLYEKARRGEHMDVPARKINVYDFGVERSKEDRQELEFYVRCSKGTYIRSLCADFARALKSCAHLTSLRREKIGDLSVDDAWQLQDLMDTYRSLYDRKPLDD